MLQIQQFCTKPSIFDSFCGGVHSSGWMDNAGQMPGTGSIYSALMACNFRDGQYRIGFTKSWWPLSLPRLCNAWGVCLMGGWCWWWEILWSTSMFSDEELDCTMSVRLHYVSRWEFLYKSNRSIHCDLVVLYLIINRSVSQIPQCINPISHNAPLYNRNVHMCANFCHKVVHSGIFIWCIMGFVRLIYLLTIGSGNAFFKYLLLSY